MNKQGILSLLAEQKIKRDQMDAAIQMMKHGKLKGKPRENVIKWLIKIANDHRIDWRSWVEMGLKYEEHFDSATSESGYKITVDYDKVPDAWIVRMFELIDEKGGIAESINEEFGYYNLLAVSLLAQKGNLKKDKRLRAMKQYREFAKKNGLDLSAIDKKYKTGPNSQVPDEWFKDVGLLFVDVI